MLVADATPAVDSPGTLDEVLARLQAQLPAGLRPARRDSANAFAGGLCHARVLG
jgi:hypothetical protein